MVNTWTCFLSSALQSDTFTPFVSSPLLPGMNFTTLGADSATLVNAAAFPAKHFRVSVSADQLGSAIEAVNSRFPGTNLGKDLDGYLLTSVMILHETLLVAGAAAGPTGGPNGKMGVGVTNFTVSVE